MDNLFDMANSRFRAEIYGQQVYGKIQVEDGGVYLCQNVFDGASCDDTLGYSKSWYVGSGDHSDLIKRCVTNLEIL